MISACILTKNDSGFIAKTIQSIRPFVQEIIVVDDHSTDDTAKIAKEAGADRVTTQTVDISTEGFAKAADEMIKLATKEYIFILDSDEILSDAEHLQSLTRYQDKLAWALPRRKWKRYPIEREEYEYYPDWQVRFFRRDPKNRFEGEMHVRFTGDKVHKAYRGPHIEHLQTECRTAEKEVQREAIYKKLAEKQGVEIVGGGVKKPNDDR